MEVYDTVSTVAIYKNGKGMTKTQRVHINNKKGYKEVTFKGPKDRKMRRTRKALTKREIHHITRCRFRKGLFKNCLV